MKKQTFHTGSGSRLTAVAIISAGNAIINPVYIFEGSRVSKEELLPDGSLKCLPVGNTWTMTDKGYMTDDSWDKVMVPYIINQAQQLRKERERPEQWVLLVMDGFGSHCCSPNSLASLLEARVKAVRMPAHTSHALQPLDVAVFKHLKVFLRDVLHAMAYIIPKALNKYELAKVFSAAWRRSMSARGDDGKSLAQIGMQKCGIFPLNINWVNENSEKFVMAETYSSSGTRMR